MRDFPRRPDADRSSDHRRGCLRAFGIAAGVVLLLGICLAILGPFLLNSHGRWLVVDDPKKPADVVVALGGGDGERLFAAVNLYKEGYASWFLIVGDAIPLLKVYTGEDSLTQGEAKRRIAVRRGVPEDSALVSLGPTSTWEEAELVREMAREHGWNSIIIVTDPFHTRRARAAFRTAFRETGIEVRSHHLPIGLSKQHPAGWWSREGDLMAVITETIKLAFYAYRYRVSPWA